MSASVHTPAAGDGVGLVVLASSLGGPSACAEILERLPPDFPAPVVVAQHHRGDAKILASLLRRRTCLEVVAARPRVRPRAGTVFVAEGQWQLLVGRDGCFARAEDGSSRCRADLLLESAALVYADRLLAVILTGNLDDGARGTVAVKAAGGRVIAQDRASSTSFGMPAAAIATGCVDLVVPLRTIAPALITLAMAPAAAQLFCVARNVAPAA